MLIEEIQKDVYNQPNFELDIDATLDRYESNVQPCLTSLVLPSICVKGVGGDDYEPLESISAIESNKHYSFPIDINSDIIEFEKPIPGPSLLESTLKDNNELGNLHSNPKNSEYCLDFLECESEEFFSHESTNRFKKEFFYDESEKKSKFENYSLEELPFRYSTDMDNEMLEIFVSKFKKRRVTLGFTQAEVGLALGVLYDKDLSQTTICRFESLQLSFNTMCKMCSLLLKWVEDTKEIALENLKEKSKKNKKIKKSYIRKDQRHLLEKTFKLNSTPNAEQYCQIAKSVELEKNVVRNWFCNKRQREKKLNGKVHIFLI